ncbi:TetR/AcrR family transcriptional regulator [Paenibacillus filicis]|uniref:TetR/AcrR family transcriptional regulator n=1 Tax=Paenibacillus filicis TaxID=669464 RepID=A0ABU9DPM8_9BACL
MNRGRAATSIRVLFQVEGAVVNMDTTRQSRKHLHTNHALKTSYISLILKSNEPDNISVSEITDRADYNRSTFYFHYKNKEELLEDMFHDALRGIAQALREPFKHQQQISVHEGIQMTSLICQHIERHQQLFLALARVSFKPSLFDRIEKLLWTMFTDEIILIKDQQDQKLDYEMSVIFHISSTVSLIKYWLLTNFTCTAAYLCEQIHSNSILPITHMRKKPSSSK